jgi:hypothetical protein
MTDQLSIYNGALTVVGERKLANLTENREPRFKLDDVWNNDIIERVLHMGLWNFAGRSVELTASPSVTPSFGHQFAFDKPENDFIRTMQVCYDQYFDLPITRYTDEGQWIFCDTEIIYFQYVSSDLEFGADFSLWPPNFTEMVEHYMAYKAGPKMIGIDISERTLESKWERTLLKAKSADAMESPARFPPQGGWARSRQGFRGIARDRGNRTQLIG